jgi:excisionase family DNA binding protein
VRDDELLTTEEVADLFKVSRLTVRRWCATGALPAIKFGHGWRISRSRLDRLIQERLDSSNEDAALSALGTADRPGEGR